MSFFRERSYEKELLDREDIPFEDIRKNMEELDIINRRLGGHAVTLHGVKALCGKSPVRGCHVVELGCGGGDNLRAIWRWARANGVQLKLTGIDINPSCIAYARARQDNAGIEFILSDYRHVVFDDPPDIVFSSLFCHHFTDDELTRMLLWKRRNSKKGFFINDLHRHPVAYGSIRLLTAVFSGSYLVKNDAPVSVKRGFVREDWQRLFGLAGMVNFSCQWKWAFRWLVVYANDKKI